MGAPPRKPRAPVSTDAADRRILCFSHLRWNFVYQRPQHLLSRAAKTFEVWFFEEPVYQAKAIGRLDVHRDACGITIATPVLPVGISTLEARAEQRRLIDEAIARMSPAMVITWYYTPMALTFAGHLTCDLCVYDNMDELSGFAGASAELIGLERELLLRADVVFTGGRSLYEAKKHRHRNIHPFPSSIDAPHFRAARIPRSEPADQAGIGHPRVGFFGVIDERMDVALVTQLAELRPDWQFIMIGPVAKIDPSILPRRSNIHWLGARPYSELPAYLSGWDIGIMPFALNESTRFISPTKTPEFLAAGLPVVSTEIADVVSPYADGGLVEIASDAPSFVETIDRLLRRPEPAWLAAVDAFLADISWDRTWDRMKSHLLCARTARGRTEAEVADV